jgi:predicted  nucleic acid-binding Zn-ribbon protein
MNVIDGIIEIPEEEKLKDKNTMLKYKMKELQDEIAELKKEVEYLRPKAIQPRNQQTKVYYCSEGISGSIY